MASNLKGKVALVTGGGSGIGKATAMAFAREGAKVAIADYVAEGGERTEREIGAAGGEAIFIQADISSTKAVEAMVNKVVQTWGRLDYAHNNAGIEGRMAVTAECTEENFDRVIAINLKGVWLCMKHEIVQMLAQGGGAIVNTASIAGLAGLPASSAYVAAKHGVVGLTRTAAIEYAAAGIRVNAVCPGFIRTAMTAPMTQARSAAVMAQTPFGRKGEPEEIAEMVVWLCSERASYVTGAAYNVDGGWMAV